MDHTLNKVRTYWFSKQAGKEIASVTDDVNSVSSSIEGGAKWLVNKIKGKMHKPLPGLLQDYFHEMRRTTSSARDEEAYSFRSLGL